ncbi:TRAP transporter large permease [Malikia granosa]|uniref:TRAP transporter large permease protein n=1 Tax=Malikia granosa TaxID=263067 RepID=A0A2S9K5I5_9BURK|nr:TRAP transporter large permease [Malikia granosa]PRD65674.1 C4-dicarboxylate ABC transporter permease [Malikia granosa]
MTGIEWGALMFVFLLVLLALRVHIGMAMMLAGSLGYGIVGGWEPLLNYFKSGAYARFSNYDLSVVPLFLLMGQFATHGGLSRALFKAGNAFIGHWKGGMAMAAVTSCAGFGAICGSSLATAATMGQVALPEMTKHGYSQRFAAAVIAAGGTLGILIPPSVPLVIYAILTEQNIAKLFMAAFIPGIVAMIGYMVVISIIARRKPDEAPAGDRFSWGQRLKAVLETWPVMLIFAVVIGGIYGGLFTPTEAASIGTVATAIVALTSGGLRGKGFMECIYGAAASTGMIFMILIGADVLNVFLVLTRLNTELAAWVIGLDMAPIAVLFTIIAIYLVLGCVMDSLSMILLTIPIFFPIIMGIDLFGLDPEAKAIWFGIIVLMVVEIGLITPPVGMNVFIISSMTKGVPMKEIFAYVMAFLASDLLRIVALVFFPVITLVALKF